MYSGDKVRNTLPATPSSPFYLRANKFAVVRDTAKATHSSVTKYQTLMGIESHPYGSVGKPNSGIWKTGRKAPDYDATLPVRRRRGAP